MSALIHFLARNVMPPPTSSDRNNDNHAAMKRISSISKVNRVDHSGEASNSTQ